LRALHSSAELPFFLCSNPERHGGASSALSSTVLTATTSPPPRAREHYWTPSPMPASLRHPRARPSGLDSLVPERGDGIQPRRPARRVEPEEDADGTRHQESTRGGRYRQERRPVREAGDEPGRHDP